ncbi:GNAT family N-acetyltransferase [Larkinella insperata]|uniref:GNAT family N-acetyltransferase n=1 Tax=Larkinella insperata TaxID=332158 RepID=A0ABW3Q5L4_9BACT|nr:GNAT family N-acetyltransferase [Larkinella insperata]
MSGPTVLLQNDTLELVVKSVADAAVADLLKTVVYGSHGIRYRHAGQELKVGLFKNPLYFHLYVSGTLRGFYCLDRRTVPGPAGPIDAFYGRYLAVTEAFQGRGYGRLLKSEAVRYVENQVSPPYLFYSYLEEKNVRSMRLSKQQGFASYGQVKTFVFRRLSPRPDSRVARIPAADLPAFLPRLRAAYHSYALYTDARIGYQGNYFGLQEGHEWVAGVQANPVSWQFLNMPGASGWLMMHVLPYLPRLNRLFSPAYRFIALEGLHLQPGKEALLPLLLEGVLAHFQLSSALIQIDSQDPLLPTVTTNMGLFSGFEPVHTHVMIKAHGLTPAQLERLRQAPFYSSSFDYT